MSPGEVCRAECSCQHLVQYCLFRMLAQWVENLPAIWGAAGDKASILDGENPLEEEVATHSSVLAGIIPGAEAPGGLRPMGSQRDTTEHTWHTGCSKNFRGTVLSVWKCCWQLLLHLPFNLWNDPGSEDGEPLPQRHMLSREKCWQPQLRSYWF